MLLYITGKRIGIALHYCEPIGAERPCGDDEVAMVMEGGSIPEKIRSVNCKCSDGEPLKIKKSYFRGWKWNHDLVCSMVGLYFIVLRILNANLDFDFFQFIGNLRI